MKKLRHLLPSALILALGLGWAWAQTFTQSLQATQDPRGPVLLDSSNNVYFPNHVLTTGKTPTLGSCVTGGTPTLVGNDWAGIITAGSTASTECTVTFATAYATAPTCLVTWASGPLAAMSWSTSTTVLTITQTSNASSVITYLCTGAK